MKNTKYWYIRLKDNFFNTKSIKGLKSQPKNADTFIVILLKLYLISLEEAGKITISLKGKENYLEKLAQLCERDKKTIRDALIYYQENNLIKYEKNEHDIIFTFPYVISNIGTSSKEADKRRESRNEEKKSITSKSQKIEEIKPINADEYESYGTFKNVNLTQSQYDSFKKEYENADLIINRLSIYYQMKNVKYNDDYAGCLSFAQKDGIKRKKKTAEEIKREQKEEINKQKEEVLNKYPDLNEIIKEINQTNIKKTKMLFRDKDSLEIKELDNKIAMLNRKMNELISMYNIPSHLF